MERLLFRNPHLAAPDWVVAVHTFATLAMMGLIWFVQVVHYPLYAKVGPQAFAEYHALHVSRTTSVVAPLMLAELGAAVWLLLDPNDRFSGWMPLVGLGLLGVIWGSTALLQVPSHGRLQEAFTPKAHAYLVGTNWIRTVAWTARGVLVVLAPMSVHGY